MVGCTVRQSVVGERSAAGKIDMKKLTTLAMLAISAAFCPPVKADNSLCSATEKVFFSCATGKKIVSICASADYPAPSAAFQYRFGPKGAPELVWPETATSRAGVTFGNIGYSGGGLGYIRFTKGDIEYVVYSGMGKGWAKDGVMVQKNGKSLANHLCKGDVIQDLWHTGLPEDDIERENAVGEAIP
jgi:hypothetical protein